MRWEGVFQYGSFFPVTAKPGLRLCGRFCVVSGLNGKKSDESLPCRRE